VEGGMGDTGRLDNIGNGLSLGLCLVWDGNEVMIANTGETENRNKRGWLSEGEQES
jgi:hypothetical protein